MQVPSAVHMPHADTGTLLPQACFGHTEGAAGLTGVLAALHVAAARAAPAVNCLRTVNAHVCAALDGWSSAAATSPALPRQSAPHVTPLAVNARVSGTACPRSWTRSVFRKLPAQALNGHACAVPGTSSFGMSGINAHALLQACSRMPHAQADAAPMIWQPARAWPGPFLHRLAHPALCTARHAR